jgi:hypothetical protein
MMKQGRFILLNRTYSFIRMPNLMKNSDGILKLFWQKNTLPTYLKKLRKGKRRRLHRVGFHKSHPQGT